MPGPGTRNPQVRRSELPGWPPERTWSRHRGLRADRRVGLPAATISGRRRQPPRVGLPGLQRCFSQSIRSRPAPQPRHCVGPRCAFRYFWSAALPVCDGHRVLGRPQPPHGEAVEPELGGTDPSCAGRAVCGGLTAAPCWPPGSVHAPLQTFVTAPPAQPASPRPGPEPGSRTALAGGLIS